MGWFIIFFLVLTTSIIGFSVPNPTSIVGRLISSDPLDADDERIIYTGTLVSDVGTVLAGWRKDQFNGWVRPSVWKLNREGTPDTPFNDGLGFYEFDYGGTVWDIHKHIDGGLTISGYSGWFNVANKKTNVKITISKLTADGKPDTAFSYDGTAVFDLAGGDDHDALSHHVLGDGSILIMGESTQGEKDDTFILKTSSTGELDLSFGSGSGSVIHGFSREEDDDAISVNVDAQGIYILGWAQSSVSESEYFSLARFLGDGTLDTSFGDGDGWVDLTTLTD